MGISLFFKKMHLKKKAFSLWKAFRPNLVKSTREMKVPVLKRYLYFSVNLLASKSPHLLGLWQKGHIDDSNKLNIKRLEIRC